MFLGLYVLPHIFLILFQEFTSLLVFKESICDFVYFLCLFISSNIYSFISLILTLYFLWIFFTFSYILKWMLISLIFNTYFEIYVFNFKGCKSPFTSFNLYHKHDDV